MADSVRLFERELAGEASRSSLTMQDERRLVSRIFASWNRIAGWLRRLEALLKTA